MKIDKIIKEIQLYLIEAIKLVMLCALLYLIFIFIYAYFGVPL